jgi:sigma-B regulation protein RsbU (phosphoserine phosphatase)
MDHSPSILLCVTDAAKGADVCQTLEEVGHQVCCLELEAARRVDFSSFHLVIIDADGLTLPVWQFCRRLRASLPEGFAPLLLILKESSKDDRLNSLDAGADTYLLRPFEPAELIAQVQAFLRIRELYGRLAAQTAELQRVNEQLQEANQSLVGQSAQVQQVNQHLRRAQQQMHLELDLARRLQRGFLPQELPVVHRLRFAAYYRPCGMVGGDFYDVLRLDEQHVGFYVADAMGHGVPAALLTIFLKQGVRPKEIQDRQYRLLSPAEVLSRLNRDLLQHVSNDAPFITMVYGMINSRDGTLALAQAGHPYPLHVPRAGPPEFWPGDGPILGVGPAEFSVQTHRLESGTKLLLYTDGFEGTGGDRRGIDRLRGLAAQYRSLPVQEHVQRLADELVGKGAHEDDLTLVGIEVVDGD